MRVCILQVPMSMVRTDSMQRLLRRYKGKYKRVVGFQPTGWTLTKNMGKQAGKRRGNGAIILYQVNNQRKCCIKCTFENSIP